MPDSELQKEKTLKVYIRSRNKDIFKGLAFSLTSQNEKGEFDVLPFHANFLTLAKKSIVLDKGMPTESKIEIDTAILNVSSDKIDVYIGL